jgi:hypothetical protein
MTKPKRDRDGICKRGPDFYISFTDAQGLRKQKKLPGCISLTEARRLRNLELTKVTEAIASRKPALTEQTFAQVIPEYLLYQRGRVKPTSYERTRDILAKHLTPVFGDMRLATIRKPDIINWVTRRSTASPRRPAASTIVKELNALRAVFNWATSQEKIEHNPCHNVKGPKIAAGRVR